MKHVGGLARRTDEGGSASAEMVVMIVVWFAFISAVVYAGRLTEGRAQVESAARAAARTISMARDPEAAVARAQADAADVAGEGSTLCTTMAFATDIVPPAGTALGTVTVDITCTVDLAAFTGFGVPGSFDVDADAVEVLDRYVERS